MPEVQLLSNGLYHVRVTASGHGASFWEVMAVTRWSPNPTGDCGGTRSQVRGDAWPASASTGSQRFLLSSGARGHDFRDGRAIDWFTGVAATRAGCVALARKFRHAGVARHMLEQTGAYRRTVRHAFGGHVDKPAEGAP